ncbi:MAG: hypothetical protein FJY07_09595 [Bacteroidetes bacterium]|nr:hypothetical protein [Bacteroidota bacterium]
MKTLILILVVLQVNLVCICQTYAPVRKGNPLEDAGKSLNGATVMSISSCIAQGIGYLGTRMPLKDDYSQSDVELRMASWLIGIGGIGMETNTPILISKARRQIKNWDCPQSDIALKEKMMKKIGAAQTISIIRTVMPAAGFIAARLSAEDDNGGEKAKNAFYGLWAASLLLTIPEFILIESANNEIKNYKQRLQVSPTEEGLGLIYSF